MTNAEIKKAFKQQIAKLLDELETEENAAIERTIRLLETLRLEIITRLAETSSQFDLTVYTQLQRGIDNALREFNRQASLELNDSMERFHLLGERLVSEPVAFVTSAPISINRNAVQIAAGYSADLIRGLSEDVRKSVNTILRRAVTGVITPAEAIKAIGKEITEGAFKTPAQRAETIVRTEVLRIQSIATHARQKESRKAMQSVGWDLKRAWLTSHDTRVRESHVLTDGQEREIEEAFDVPMILKGVVVGTEKLMYPRDENASAANSINCRCIALSKLVKLA